MERIKSLRELTPTYYERRYRYSFMIYETMPSFPGSRLA
jgi:hypothetical protein